MVISATLKVSRVFLTFWNLTPHYVSTTLVFDYVEQQRKKMKINKQNPIETRFINKGWDDEINKILLGGNWFTPSGISIIRNYDDSLNRSIGVGFRICRTIKEQK